MYSRAEKRFLTYSLATIIAVYLLILVGGIVRSTGSGMGCPDWPKCFGSWVPPADESALPAGYAEELTQKRLEKNTRFYNLLDALGISHASLSEEHLVTEDIYFNPAKAWIEYINRLIGVAIGILIFLTLVFSVRLYKSHRKVVWLSILSFVLVCFQGWLGSVVVSTNLFPGLITLHMLLALALVILLIYAHLTVRRTTAAGLQAVMPSRLVFIRVLLILLMGLTLVQIVVGTQVRETVDRVAVAYGYQYRESWIPRIADQLNLHRDLGLGVLVLTAGLWMGIRQGFDRRSGTRKAFSWYGLVLLIQLFSGMALARWGLPPVLQPVHLLLGTLILGLQFYLSYTLYPARGGMSKAGSDL